MDQDPMGPRSDQVVEIDRLTGWSQTVCMAFPLLTFVEFMITTTIYVCPRRLLIKNSGTRSLSG